MLHTDAVLFRSDIGWCWPLFCFPLTRLHRRHFLTWEGRGTSSLPWLFREARGETIYSLAPLNSSSQARCPSGPSERPPLVFVEGGFRRTRRLSLMGSHLLMVGSSKCLETTFISFYKYNHKLVVQRKACTCQW